MYKNQKLSIPLNNTNRINYAITFHIYQLTTNIKKYK